MAEYITKKYTKKAKNENEKNEVIETQYRVDADFIPQKADEICQDFIVNYCEKTGEEDWLYRMFTEKIERKDKEGNIKQVERTALEVRKEFIAKFFPSLVVEKKPKTAKELFLQRYREKNK